MARLVLFGVPLGFSCSECTEDDGRYLECFYNGAQDGTKLKISRRANGDVYYSYLMYPKKNEIFADVSGRNGAFFGMSLILKNQEIADNNKISKLFQKTYQDYIKGKIIREFPNGNKKFLVNSLADKNDTLAKCVAKGFIKIMQENPDLDVFKDIKLYKPSQPTVVKNYSRRF